VQPGDKLYRNTISQGRGSCPTRRRFDAVLKSVGQYSDRPEALMNAEAVEPY
jgi:hypothetical protein